MSDPSVKLSNRTYDNLKRIVTLILPAAGTLYFTIAAIWGLPRAEEVVGTITATVLFLGVVLGISSHSYEKSGDKYDGDLVVEGGEDGGKVISLALTKLDDPLSVINQDQVVFKVRQMPES